MARIRSVHPGLLTDEAFMTLTVECPTAIALMLGLWVEADDSGTFEWKPITIKAKCLPALPTDVNELLDALARVDMIRQFEFDGKLYGVIRNFVKYQRPKDPKDTHPSSEESRNFAGFTSEGTRPNPTTGRKSFGTTSEPLRKSLGTTSENSAQRKEVGGRRDLDDSEILDQRKGGRRRVERAPSPSEPKPVEILAEVVSPQTAADIVAHRKAMRKPLTDRAAKEIATALAQTGEPEAAAAHMIKSGWQGFSPEWYANSRARAGPPQQERSTAFRTSKPSANF